MTVHQFKSRLGNLLILAVFIAIVPKVIGTATLIIDTLDDMRGGVATSSTSYSTDGDSL